MIDRVLKMSQTTMYQNSPSSSQFKPSSSFSFSSNAFHSSDLLAKVNHNNWCESELDTNHCKQYLLSDFGGIYGKRNPRPGTLGETQNLRFETLSSGGTRDFRWDSRLETRDLVVGWDPRTGTQDCWNLCGTSYPSRNWHLIPEIEDSWKFRYYLNSRLCCMVRLRSKILRVWRLTFKNTKI